ncbi:MAG: CxxxxCH/CxxCH domain-containing protein [Thermodesulfovibrionia bacterium]|nr:CxxxxCH/CxxCH domain-containing protein [Thermodesulfovibrionia bacterium]
MMKTKRFNNTGPVLFIVLSMVLAVFITGAAFAANPDLPVGPEQYVSKGDIAITQGGTTDESTIRIKASVSDPDLNNVQIQVEIIDSSASYTNTPNCASSFVLNEEVATASCTGLQVGTSYKWQVRANDGTGTSAWVQFGATNPDVTISSNRILHNSANLGNASYGAWGVDGGKYGEFVCATCHTKSGSTTNIKMVKQTITSPNASDTWPNGSINTGSIIFTSATGTYADTGDASSTGGWTGVCNVCHDNANHDHYSYNSSDGHLAGQDCNECHRHSVGYKVACDTCHGQPPIMSDTINTMVSIPGTTGSAIAGAHNLHVNTKSYICDTCHYNNISSVEHNNGGSRDISIGFYIASGSIQGGNYNGQSGVGYDALTTSAPTTVTTPATGAKTCTVYCHSSVQSADGSSTEPAFYAAPVWDSNVVCGGCHKTNAPYEMIDTGSHVQHLTISGVNGCGDCHTGASNDASSYASSTHVNFLIDVANSYSAGGARGNGYGTCAEAACHNDGTTNSLSSPTWGNITPMCSQCHGAAPATGSHTAHLTTTVNGSSIVCGNCHKDAVQSVSPPSSPDHLDGNVDVKDVVDGDLGYPANVAKHTSGSGYSACTNASCHVSAYGTGMITTEIWGTTSTCGTCHTIDVNGAPATGSHDKHLASSALCGNCHNGSVKDTSGGTAHIDGNIDVTNNYASNVAKHAAGSGYSSCSSIYCHSNVQAPGGASGATIFATPTWGSGALSCSSCHTDMSTTEDLTLGTHKRHTNTPGVAQFACSMCHGIGYSSATVTYPPHVNNNIDLSFTGQASGTYYSQVGSNPPGNGYGTCSTSNCHGRGTKNWGFSTESPTCEKCHGSADTASATLAFKDTAGSTGSVYAGTHVSHIVGIHNYSIPITCDKCHITPTNPSDAGHNDTAVPAELTFASMATHNRLVGTVYTSAMAPTYSGSPTRQCSNTYCHAGVRATNDGGDDLGPDGSGPSPVWGDPAYLGGSGCGKCHGNPPAYPHENYSANCTACHTHVAGNNIGFTDKTKHLNGSLEWDVDACIDCHSFESSRPLIGAHVLHTDPDYMLSTFQFSGTATGGTTTTLEDTSQSWVVNILVGKYVRLNSGSNIYDQAKITANTATTITIAAALPFSIANGNTYEVRAAKLLTAGDYGDPSWIYSISYKNGFPKYACGTCHPMDDPTIRNNGIVELDLDPSHAAAGTVKTKNAPIGPYPPMSSTGEWFQRTTGVSVICNGIYCHSNGYVTSGTYAFKETPDWYDVTITASGTVTSEPWSSVDRCAQCHGNSPNTGGTEGSTAHAKHVVGVHYKDLYSGTTGEMSATGSSGAAHGDPLSSTTINCNICHSNTVSDGFNDKNTICSTCHTASPEGTMYVKLDNQSHINGTVNVSFASATTIKSRAQVRDYITTVTEINNNWTRTNGYKASNSYDTTEASKSTPNYSAGTCLTTACHNGTPMEWEQAGPLSCNACHKGLAQ